jgi:hypothetical protein
MALTCEDVSTTAPHPAVLIESKQRRVNSKQSTSVCFFGTKLFLYSQPICFSKSKLTRIQNFLSDPG